jgi:hypothetical protein
MESKKRKAAAKTSVKFRDLKSKRDPKGGALNAYQKAGPQAITATWVDGG